MWKMIIPAVALLTVLSGATTYWVWSQPQPKSLSSHERWVQTINDLRQGQENLRQAGHVTGETMPMKRFYDKVPPLPPGAPNTHGAPSIESAARKIGRPD
jgi:hypothetical protein